MISGLRGTAGYQRAVTRHRSWQHPILKSASLPARRWGSYGRAVTRLGAWQPPICRNAYFTGAAGWAPIGGQLHATSPDSTQFEYCALYRRGRWGSYGRADYSSQILTAPNLKKCSLYQRGRLGSYRRAVTRHRSWQHPIWKSAHFTGAAGVVPMGGQLLATDQPPIWSNAYFTGAAGGVPIGGQLLATDPDSPQFEEMLTLPGQPDGFL